MAEMRKSFADFMRDEDGEYSDGRILSVVKDLRDEGRRTHSICHALLNAAIEVSFDDGIDYHRYFLNDLKELADYSIAQVELMIAEKEKAAEPQKQ
ncbi:MAG: hypothetical protein SV201_09695 [Pseudomonadota bacterium]|nr:hypothetical protein [Pseudomonadota bacterium]